MTAPAQGRVLIRVSGTRPVTHLKVQLIDDGKVGTDVFLDDGRLVAGLWFAATVRGRFWLQVSAWDEAGCLGTAQGRRYVTVR